jgi:hypothetical protein
VIRGGANFLLRNRAHITIRPDGEIAVSFDNVDVTCK